MDEEKKGRCVGCGYLAWREFGNERGECYEVTSEERVTGKRPISGPAKECSGAPQCQRRETIHKEYADLQSEGLNHEEIYLRVIRTDRSCPKYFPYKPGESPKRHAEMSAEAKAEEVKVQAAESEEDKAERRHLADLICRIMEDDRRRDWEDARFYEQKDRDDAREERQRQDKATERIWQSNQNWWAWFRSIVTWVILLVLGIVSVFGNRWLDSVYPDQRSERVSRPAQTSNASPTEKR